MKIGLFFSRARGVVSGVIDLDELAASYPMVDVVKIYDDFFTAKDQEDLIAQARDNDLDAVVLAGNSPKYYEDSLSGSLFLEELEEQGINPNRIAFANLLEQIAFLNAAEAPAAQIKAKAYVDIALSRAMLSSPIEQLEHAPRQSVLVIGATVAGIVATQRLLQMGFRVYVLDRQSPPPRDFELYIEEMAPTIAWVERHPSAHLLYNAELIDIDGMCGDYTVSYMSAGVPSAMQVGGIIVAVSHEHDADWMAEIRPVLQIDVDGEGHYRSKNPTTLPVQTAADGIAVVPPDIEGGKLVRDKVAAADSAVLHVATFLLNREVHRDVAISHVDEDVCGGCGVCVKTCFFKACTVDLGRHRSTVDSRRCRGCGKCVVACPTGAKDLLIDPTTYIFDAIRILAETPPLDGVKVLAFACNGCGYPSLDSAGRLSKEDGAAAIPASILPLRIRCGGRLDSQFVLTAFKQGFDAVAVIRCHEGQCHNVIGNLDMDRRLNLLREVLRAQGIDSERLRLLDTSVMEGAELARELQKLVTDIKELRGVAHG